MVHKDELIHLIAGGVGGTTGAIFTCPLEVVKTRLQSSNSGFDTSLKAVSLTGPEPEKTSRNNGSSTSCPSANNNKSRPNIHKVTYRPVFGSQYSANLLNGGQGYFGSTTPILYSTQSQPCRPVKTKLSSFPDRATKPVHTSSHNRAVHTASVPDPGAPQGRTLEVWRCLRHIWVHEGPSGLFRGLGPNLVGVAPSRAIYFWSYSSTKQKLNRILPAPNRDTPFVHVVSAASAGFISSCLTNPLWLVKTRLQLDRSNTNFLSTVKNIHSEQGLAGFWKGVTASWWGISETIIHFVIYESLKKRLAESRNSPLGEKKSIADFLGYMLCGATSKTCATCVAYPHEVARTRMRESGNKYRSFWQTLRLVAAEEGRRGLYRGLGTQLVRQIPNTAIMMATYELTVYFLNNYINKVNLEGMPPKNPQSQ